MSAAVSVPAADRFMTRQQTAELLGLSAGTLAKWAMTGIGPEFSKVNGRVVRYRMSRVQAFMDANVTK